MSGPVHGNGSGNGSGHPSGNPSGGAQATSSSGRGLLARLAHSDRLGGSAGIAAASLLGAGSHAGAKDARLLHDVLAADKGVVSMSMRLATEHTRSAHALREWATAQGPDLKDVLGKVGELVALAADAHATFAERTQRARQRTWKELRAKEEHFARLRRARDGLGAKIESHERKVSKMKEESKDLPAAVERLREMQHEMRALEHSVLVDDAALGDARRHAARDAVSLKLGQLGALAELGEKLTIVGDLGKHILDAVPVQHTEPGHPRAIYSAYDATDAWLSLATERLARVALSTTTADPAHPLVHPQAQAEAHDQQQQRPLHPYHDSSLASSSAVPYADGMYHDSYAGAAAHDQQQRTDDGATLDAYQLPPIAHSPLDSPYAGTATFDDMPWGASSSGPRAPGRPLAYDDERSMLKGAGGLASHTPPPTTTTQQQQQQQQHYDDQQSPHRQPGEGAAAQQGFAPLPAGPTSEWATDSASAPAPAQDHQQKSKQLSPLEEQYTEEDHSSVPAQTEQHARERERGRGQDEREREPDLEPKFYHAHAIPAPVAAPQPNGDDAPPPPPSRTEPPSQQQQPPPPKLAIQTTTPESERSTPLRENVLGSKHGFQSGPITPTAGPNLAGVGSGAGSGAPASSSSGYNLPADESGAPPRSPYANGASYFDAAAPPTPSAVAAGAAAGKRISVGAFRRSHGAAGMRDSTASSRFAHQGSYWSPPDTPVSPSQADAIRDAYRQRYEQEQSPRFEVAPLQFSKGSAGAASSRQSDPGSAPPSSSSAWREEFGHSPPAPPPPRYES